MCKVLIFWKFIFLTSFPVLVICLPFRESPSHSSTFAYGTRGSRWARAKTRLSGRHTQPVTEMLRRQRKHGHGTQPIIKKFDWHAIPLDLLDFFMMSALLWWGCRIDTCLFVHYGAPRVGPWVTKIIQSVTLTTWFILKSFTFSH